MNSALKWASKNKVILLKSQFLRNSVSILTYNNIIMCYLDALLN